VLTIFVTSNKSINLGFVIVVVQDKFLAILEIKEIYNK